MRARWLITSAHALFGVKKIVIQIFISNAICSTLKFFPLFGRFKLIINKIGRWPLFSLNSIKIREKKNAIKLAGRDLARLNVPSSRPWNCRAQKKAYETLYRPKYPSKGKNSQDSMTRVVWNFTFVYGGKIFQNFRDYYFFFFITPTHIGDYFFIPKLTK